MKYGLALEGGGARGAYHIGAVKALKDNGVEFEAVCATSIGAINAAMIVQDDIDLIYDMWKTLSFKDLFDIDEEKLQKAYKKLTPDTIKYLSKKLGNAIKNGGINTEKIKNILENIIDEEKIRKSAIDFGLVTVCLSDKKAQELYIKSIPKNSLVDYIMASCNLPVFKRAKIDNKRYIDGGIYDNCPVHMLEEKGYNNIIAIRTFKRNRIRDYKNIVKRGNAKITMIEPIDILPSILNFASDNLNEILQLGYFDAVKVINKLDGYRYYVLPESEDTFLQRIIDINSNEIKNIAILLKVQFCEKSNMKKVLLENIIPLLISKTKTHEANTYKSTMYALVEYVARKENINRFTIYNKFENFLNVVKEKINYENKTIIDEAIYRLVNNI